MSRTSMASCSIVSWSVLRRWWRRVTATAFTRLTFLSPSAKRPRQWRLMAFAVTPCPSLNSTRPSLWKSTFINFTWSLRKDSPALVAPCSRPEACTVVWGGQQVHRRHHCDFSVQKEKGQGKVFVKFTLDFLKEMLPFSTWCLKLIQFKRAVLWQHRATLHYQVHLLSAARLKTTKPNCLVSPRDLGSCKYKLKIWRGRRFIIGRGSVCVDHTSSWHGGLAGASTASQQPQEGSPNWSKDTNSLSLLKSVTTSMASPKTVHYWWLACVVTQTPFSCFMWRSWEESDRDDIFLLWSRDKPLRIKVRKLQLTSMP